MRDFAEPWICHMLTVFVAAYVAGRLFKTRWLAVVFAAAFGAGFIIWLGTTAKIRESWLEAQTYANYVYAFRTLSRDPGDFAKAFVLCWITPIMIAWLTIKWRARKPKPDGVDD